MKGFLFSMTFFVAIFAQRSVDVVTESTSSDTQYFKTLKLYYDIRKEGDNFISSVSQSKSSNSPNFKATSYSVNNDGTLLSPPSLALKDNTTSIALEVTFKETELTENYGCTELQDDDEYYTIVCKLQLNYESLNGKEKYLRTTYSMGIKIKKRIKTEYALGIDPILVDGCECELILDVETKSEIFTDSDCSIPLDSTATVTYGSTLCLKLYSADKLVSNLYFQTTMLMMTYKTASGKEIKLDIMSVSQLSCGNPCKPGISYAIFDISLVGQIEFQQVVLLVEKRRRLSGNDELNPGDLPLEERKGISKKYKTITMLASGNSYANGRVSVILAFLAAIAILML
jgi:hypothetical protein